MLRYNKQFDDLQISAYMGWKHVRYIQDSKSIIFIIDPMVGRPDIVYVPEEKSWQNTAPEWAKNLRDHILNTLKSIPWNRKLQWVDTKTKVIEKDIFEDFILPGTPEATLGGRKYTAFGLFNPRSPVSPEEAHELWCDLEKQFAQEAKGIIPVYTKNSKPYSVFTKISLPILKKNTSVSLEYVD
ncbi:MAG: hypothetical protein GX895_03240 [Clostridiales bacterium]|uniref:hypothetical protein n=1 Tax=Clostridium sp. N3C TaxID=1776758 RepID=UPI00092E167B|nr:hypothetical protein [Clostridium sp. N3C]NLZ47796.1 hypothetical protein [Clostridiales bacterium]SCN24908.1 hypothetical protein N3C_2050 [Clostridium sp. N3C]